VLSGSQVEVSVSMLQVKNVRSSPVVAVVLAPADCGDGSKAATFPLQQASRAALLSPQSGAEQIAVLKLEERHSVGTLGERLLGQSLEAIVVKGF
jgi:hypothetical protein